MAYKEEKQEQEEQDGHVAVVGNVVVAVVP